MHEVYPNLGKMAVKKRSMMKSTELISEAFTRNHLVISRISLLD
jgi:hypothetical protein